MKHKHILIIALFVFFSCTLAAAQTRKIEAKKKTQESSGFAMNNPELVFNVGHSGAVNSVCYSPDGKYVASASGANDHTIKLWELATGRVVKTLTGHTGGINSVTYSLDGAYLASGSADDGTVKIWEVGTWNCVKTLEASEGRALCYSPDGAYLAGSSASDGTVKIWEVGTWNCVKTLKASGGKALCYSPDGAYLASASADDGNTIELWEVETGKCVKTLEGHTNWVTSVVYSPYGKYVASCSLDKTVKIWEVESGKCIKTLEGHTDIIESISYSPSGKYLASGSWDKTVKIWEVESGKCIKTLEGHAIFVYFVVFSPDGKYLASSSPDQTIKLWEITSWECKKTLGGHTTFVMSISYSPDGKYLASGLYDKVIKIFEVATGKCIKILTEDVEDAEFIRYIESMTYSPDGKYIASGCCIDGPLDTIDYSWNNTIKVWELESGKCIKTLEGHGGHVTSVRFSPDGKYVASASYDETIKIWEISTGMNIKTLTGHISDVQCLAYSPNGEYIASGSAEKYKYTASGSVDGTVKLWEVGTGECIKTLSGHTGSIYSICYSPDGAYLASGSSDGTIKLWEVESGKCVKTFDGDGDWEHAVSFSPDGKYLANGSDDKTIKLWEVESGKCIKTLTGHTERIRSVCYSPDGNRITSVSYDQTIKFWDASTGALLATTFNLKEGEEWLTYTPEGFFAGSEWATKNLVHIVDGMKTIGIDQMYDSLYRPDLVSAKLSGEDISPYAQKVNFASLMQTGSAPVVTFLSLEDEVKDRDVTIEFAIQNTGGGIGEVNLLLNGKNIRLAEKASSKTGETVHFSHTITLQNGKNTVELYAKNEAGKVESLHVSKTLNWQGSVKKPNLYIFTVAINKYRDRRLQLKYAVPDAEFILKGFSSQKKSLYQNIFTHHLFDDNVTRDGLKSSFEKLGDEVQADDVFVFYIAGHGITYDEDGDYYYLPSNFRFTNSEAIQQQGISKNDLTRYLSLIKAGKTLMLMDTCNAGSFLGNNTRGLSEQTAIDRLSRSTGHATIVASSDDQVAMEGYEGHGIFTYILVEGLRGKADTDGDGFITLQELSAYTEEEVPRRSYEKWGYEQTPMRNLRRQDFPIYTSGNR